VIIFIKVINMSYRKDLRIVISCVTFDTVKIIEPIKFFKADKAYLFHKADRIPYTDFLDEIIRQLESLGIEHKEIFSNVNKFEELMPDLIKVMENEIDNGNHVFVNIEAGSAVYSSASLIASMMLGATPFNEGSKDHMIDDHKKYYDEKGRPVGLAKSVREPYLLPAFHLEKPPEKLVHGLKIWNEVRIKYGNRKLKETIQMMEKTGLLKDCMERNKVSHSGHMFFRRNFLQKWIDKGWIEKDEERIYQLTSDGEMIIKVL